jgi:hypothetical protein
MAWLPGWDSPHSVATYRTVTEALGLGFVLFGAVFGMLAFFYNHRLSEMEAADKQSLQERVTATNESASRANAEAKRLEAELEAEKQGRLLSPEKLADLTRHLHSALRPKAKIELMGIQGDRESMRLAEQLAPAFRDAGFTVSEPYDTTFFGPVGKGVLIRQVSKDGPIGVGIAAAFAAVGLESRVFEMGADRNIGSDDVELIIGRRP